MTKSCYFIHVYIFNAAKRDKGAENKTKNRQARLYGWNFLKHLKQSIVLTEHFNLVATGLIRILNVHHLSETECRHMHSFLWKVTFGRNVGLGPTPAISRIFLFIYFLHSYVPHKCLDSTSGRANPNTFTQRHRKNSGSCIHRTTPSAHSLRTSGK
jgi:hypothetical protein